LLSTDPLEGETQAENGSITGEKYADSVLTPVLSSTTKMPSHYAILLPNAVKSFLGGFRERVPGISVF
jgi:hypothetical protein